MARNVRRNSRREEDDVLQAARELAEALRTSSRVKIDVASLLRLLTDAQRHADSIQGEDWSRRLALLLRDPPADVNPFASPEFFVRLYVHWLEVRVSSVGIDESGRRVMTASDDAAGKAFKAMLAAIQESLPRRSRGRCKVSWMEAHCRQRLEEEARRVASFLERMLDDVGRPTEYDSLSAFEAAICKNWMWSHLHEASGILWHYRTRRGAIPLLKAARRLTKLISDLHDEPLRSSLRPSLPSLAPLALDLSAPRPRKCHDKS